MSEVCGVCGRWSTDLEMDIAQLKARVKALNERMESIREYAQMIPLHTEDSHVRHFAEQIAGLAEQEG